jgi:adenine/guanine phosphoribosyltransferase-like PRPP-binding protein
MNFPPARLATKLKIATMGLGEHIEQLKPDALAYSGHSGAAFAFIAGVFHQLPIINVRKVGEQSHGSAIDSNSTEPIRTYLVVDDFINTGATVKHIIRSIDRAAAKYNNHRPKCMGIFLYASEPSCRNRIYIDDEVYDILV